MLGNSDNLASMMGEQKLSEYVKLFDLTLGLEAFLTKSKLTKAEVDLVEKFIPKYIKDFVDCINRQEGHDMKLVKIHLLNHFVDCIWLYGSAMIFNGAVGESHLKTKTKQPAQRTKMDTQNMEYQTAVKDYENIVLEYGYDEIMQSRKKLGNDNVIEAQPKQNLRLGRRFKMFQNNGKMMLKEISHKKKSGEDLMTDWQGFFSLPSLQTYLENLGLQDILLHTECNLRGCKIYGNPLKPRQDWIEVKIEDCIFQVQCLIFFILPESLQDEIVTPLDTVCQPGTYAIVHFMGYDVFGDPPGNLQLYRTPQTGFYQHDDCFLIRGWSKHTESIHDYFDANNIPEPIVAMVNLKHFKRPLIAISDPESGYPHSWLFTPERKCWGDAFVLCMMHDVRLK